MSKKLKVSLFVENKMGKGYMVGLKKSIKAINVKNIEIDSIYRAYTFDDDRARTLLKEKIADDAFSDSMTIAKLSLAMNMGKNVTRDHVYIFMMFWTVFSVDFVGSPYENNFNIKDCLNRAVFRSLYDGSNAQHDDSKE